MNKNPIRYLYVARACSVFSDQLLSYGIPLIVYQLRNSIVDSGLAFFFQTAARLVALSVSGKLSDRLGAVRTHEWADMSRLLGCVVCLVAGLLTDGHVLFWLLSILGGLIAFSNALAYVSLETATGRIALKESLAQTQAQFQMIDQSANLLGPLVAASLALGIGKLGLLGVAALAFAVSFVCLRNICWVENERAEISYKPQSQWSVLRHVFSYRPVLAFIGLSIVLNFGVGIYKSLLPAIVTSYYSEPESRIAWITALGGVMGILSMKFVGLFIDAKKTAVSTGLTAFWILIGLLAVSSYGPFTFFMIAASLSVVCMAVFNVCQRTTRLQLLPKEMLGQSIGLIILVNQLSLPLAGLFVAGLSKVVTDQVTLFRVAMTATFLLGLAPSLLLLKKEVMALKWSGRPDSN